MTRTTSRLRRLAPVALAATATLIVAGCGGSGSHKDTKASSDCKTASEGSASKAVKVTGDIGKEQKATFKTPLKATKVERTLVDDGDGKMLAKGRNIDVKLSVYLGKDGKSLGSQTGTAPVGDSSLPKGFAAAFDCSPVHSRTVVVTPAKEVFGAEGNPSAGIAADDTLVLVADVLDAKEEPKPKPWSNPPKITFDSAGKPTITVPKGATAPADVEVKVLKPGTGPEVKKTDQVVMDYQGVAWQDGKVFDQSYGKPELEPMPVTGFVPGFTAALVGQKVGSTIAVTIPKKYAYGDQEGNPLQDKDLIFVVHIKKASAS